MYKNDCIAGIATGRETAGVGIVRLSGSNCFEVAAKVFAAAGGKAFAALEARMMVYGKIDCGGFFDRGLCVKFYGPASYTGEDMAELHCHGGIEVMEGALRSCLAAGARMAECGEFTRRAFLNGKLDLSSCEGVAGMISARSSAEAAAAEKLLDGELFKQVSFCQQALTDVLSMVEAGLDYPEEDLPAADMSAARQKLLDAADRLRRIADSYRTGSKLRDGLQVVLCGAANAGKSSLFNRLLGEDRAIVTEVAGTTRDTLQGEAEWQGVRVVLWDTAGLRESGDRVEKLGIDRTLTAAARADIVIAVREDGDDGEFEQICRLAEGKPLIVLRSKADIHSHKAEAAVCAGKSAGAESTAETSAGAGNGAASVESTASITDELWVSAVTGEGLDRLRAAVLDAAGAGDIKSGLVLTNERHFDAVRRAGSVLDEALGGFEIKTADILAAELGEAWQILGEITGVTASEHIIDEIFSKFCLGK